MCQHQQCAFRLTHTHTTHHHSIQYGRRDSTTSWPSRPNAFISSSLPCSQRVHCTATGSKHTRTCARQLQAALMLMSAWACAAAVQHEQQLCAARAVRTSSSLTRLAERGWSCRKLALEKDLPIILAYDVQAHTHACKCSPIRATQAPISLRSRQRHCTCF